MNDQPAPRIPPASTGGLRIGRVRATLPVMLFTVALFGSVGYILWVVREVQDNQIELLSYGFAALGLTFAAIAIASVFGMWRASSRAAGGRSFGLAVVGGLAGLAAIGSFSVMALLTLVLNS